MGTQKSQKETGECSRDFNFNKAVKEGMSPKVTLQQNLKGMRKQPYS